MRMTRQEMLLRIVEFWRGKLEEDGLSKSRCSVNQQQAKQLRDSSSGTCSGTPYNLGREG